MKQVVLSALLVVLIQSSLLLALAATPVGAQIVRGQVVPHVQEQTAPQLGRLESSLWELRVLLKGATPEEKAVFTDSPWLLLPQSEQSEGKMKWQQHKAGFLEQDPMLTPMQNLSDGIVNGSSLLAYMEQSARWQEESARWQQDVDVWTGETNKRLQSLETRVATQVTRPSTPSTTVTVRPSPSQPRSLMDKMLEEDRQRAMAREEAAKYFDCVRRFGTGSLFC